MSPFDLKRVTEALAAHHYRYASEAQLHKAISQVLAQLAIPFEHEKIAGEDRFDFYADGLVLEVKINGSYSEALRQVDRYCQRPDVQAVAVVTSKAWGYVKGEHTLSGKPVWLIKVRGQAF